MKSVSCIYIIINQKNGMIYIGQAQNLRKRWNEHKNTLRKGEHHNIHLQRAWNKYGEKSFKFKVLEFCSTEDLDKREQHFMDIYIPKGVCYNIAPIAQTTRGVPVSDETRIKLSTSGKGKKRSEETRARMSAAMKGISRNKGHKKSLIHREKIGASQRKKYIVTNPDGIEFEIVGLAKFCRENGLSAGNMSLVASGRWKHSKGYKCRKVE